MMNQKEQREFDSMKEQVERYKYNHELQQTTIYTYQEFFLMFGEDLAPIVEKWKREKGIDPYIKKNDPIQERVDSLLELTKDEIRDEERQNCTKKLEKQRATHRKRCTCGKV